MADAFLLEDLFDGDHEACLQHVVELVVDAGPEGAHGRGERHVCVDERRNIMS